MVRDYSYPDNTRKRTTKRKICEKTRTEWARRFFCNGGGGDRGPWSKPAASRTLHTRLTPLFSSISLSLARFFLKRNTKQRCIIPPYFSRFISLLELPLHAFSEFFFKSGQSDKKTPMIVGQTKVCLHRPLFPVFFPLLSWAPTSLSYPTFRKDKRANTLARKTTSLWLAHCKVLILSVRTCNFQHRCKTK